MKKEIFVLYGKLDTTDFPDYAKYAFTVKDNVMHEKRHSVALVFFSFILEDNSEVYYKTKGYSMITSPTGTSLCAETYLDEVVNIEGIMYTMYNLKKQPVSSEQAERLNAEIHGRAGSQPIRDTLSEIYNANCGVKLINQLPLIAKSLLPQFGAMDFYANKTSERAFEYLKGFYD